MDELKQKLLLKVRDHAAMALSIASQMPGEVQNPMLLVMTDLDKVQSQISALSSMKSDVKQIGNLIHALYAKIADYLSIPDDQLMPVEDLIEHGALLGASYGSSAPVAVGASSGDTESAASGAKYRDAIRKEIGKTHVNVEAKGGNIFTHETGSYFLGFYQKSGSKPKELKYSLNRDVITDLKAMTDGRLYLVGKDGLIADVAVSELDAHDNADGSRWEFFVSVLDDAVDSVKGSKRAFDVEFDQFSVGVIGSAE